MRLLCRIKKILLYEKEECLMHSTIILLSLDERENLSRMRNERCARAC